MKKHIFFIILLIIGIYASYFLNLKQADYTTDADRVTYIEKYGWKVAEKSFDHEKIKIPLIFNQTLKNYNDLQRRSGFDLEHCKGNIVDKYSYKLLNHPKDKQYAYINIFVYQNNIVAADIVSPKINGSISAITDKE